MANEQNLISIQEVNSRRTREEHSKDSAKGGKKSGEVRRQRKAMKEQMELLLSLPFNLKDSKGNDAADSLEFLGIDKKDIDNQMAMNIMLWKTAIDSNNRQQIQAIKEIREITRDNKEDKTNIDSVKEILVKIREVANNDGND